MGFIQDAGDALSGLASLGGLAGTVKSLFGSHSAERRAIRNQKDLMNFSANLQDEMIRKQNQYNMDSWMQQNEYNSPVNQMKRLQEAGLNPNLVYGGSGSVAGNAESIQSGSGVSLQGSSDSTKAQSNEIMKRQLDLQLMRQYKEIGVLDSQIELNKSGANRNNAEADQVGPNAESQRSLNETIGNLNKALESLNTQVKEREQYYTEVYKDTMFYRKMQVMDEWYLTKEQIFKVRNDALVSLAAFEKAGIDYQIAKYSLDNILPKQAEKLSSAIKLDKAMAFHYIAQGNFMVLNGRFIAGPLSNYYNSASTLNDYRSYHEYWAGNLMKREDGWKGKLYGSKFFTKGTVLKTYYDGINSYTDALIKDYKYDYMSTFGVEIGTGIQGSGISLPGGIINGILSGKAIKQWWNDHFGH